jgi:hypothetical protein
MFAVIFLVGAAMFGAAVFLEKRQPVPAGGAASGSPLIDGLKLGGVVLATIGASGVAILASVAAASAGY